MERCEKCGRPYGKTRSNRENRYYWPVVIGILVEATGNSKQAMHMYLRSQFADPEVVTMKGQSFYVPKSTTEMTTGEFEQYLSDCRQWASEEGYFIPLPNEAPLGDR